METGLGSQRIDLDVRSCKPNLEHFCSLGDFFNNFFKVSPVSRVGVVGETACPEEVVQVLNSSTEDFRALQASSTLQELKNECKLRSEPLTSTPR